MALSVKQTQSILYKIKRFSWYSSAYIKTIQIYLNKLGYKLVVDGICGYYTINAIYDFQNNYGLVKDGIPGSKTLAKLKAIVSPSATLPAAVATSIYMTAEDWKASKYFKRAEFECGCHKKYCNGYPVEVRKQLITVLTMLREYLTKLKNKDTPVNITSGSRCKKFNSTLKGASPASVHLYGGAADFYVSGVDIKDVLAYCQILKKQGYIKYYYTNSTNMKGAVHINI